MKMNIDEALRILNARPHIITLLSNIEKMDRNDSNPAIRLLRTQALLEFTEYAIATSKSLTAEITDIGDCARRFSASITEEARLAKEIDGLLRSRLSGGLTQSEAEKLRDLAHSKGKAQLIRQISDGAQERLKSYWKKSAALVTLESTLDRLRGKVVVDAAGNVTTKGGCVKVDKFGNIVA